MTPVPNKFTGHFFILVGPTGSGKNSLMAAAIEAIPGLRQMPTATTRTIRSGEEEGREHYFVSTEYFQELIRTNALLEWQFLHRHGRYYGMLRGQIELALASDENIIADVDYLGAQAADDAYPTNVITIFITPPGISELLRRLLSGRGESLPETSRRLLRAPQEFAYTPSCRYNILNDSHSAAASTLIQIIQSEITNQRASIEQAPRLEMQIMSQLHIHAPHGELIDEHSGEAPTFKLLADELPQRAAERGLREILGDSAHMGHWQHHFEADDGFQPPNYLSAKVLADGVEAAVYHYRYDLDVKPELPQGYRWRNGAPEEATA
ncbi:MAG: guanylate kinase [Anaerolineae bacterium]|nr:guanylate kinase [Anaerolineae bacterium]